MTINQSAREIEALLDVLIEEDWDDFDDLARDDTLIAEPVDVKEDEEDGFLTDLQNALRELEHF